MSRRYRSWCTASTHRGGTGMEPCAAPHRASAPSIRLPPVPVTDTLQPLSSPTSRRGGGLFSSLVPPPTGRVAALFPPSRHRRPLIRGHRCARRRGFQEARLSCLRSVGSGDFVAAREWGGCRRRGRYGPAPCPSRSSRPSPRLSRTSPRPCLSATPAPQSKRACFITASWLILAGALGAAKAARWVWEKNGGRM